jgi:hypothetical protein
VKELRNILRLAMDPDEEFVGALGEVKDAIGDWHDWEELLAIAEELLDHGAKCKLVRELKRISHKKYQNALQLTENMRKNYLEVAGRKQQEPAKPARLAVRAIAA